MLNLLLPSATCLVSASLTYKDVIADYCKAHDLKPNIKAIVEAVLVAVDTSKFYVDVYGWRTLPYMSGFRLALS